MKIQSIMPQVVTAMGGSAADAAKAARAAEVRRMWEVLMRQGGDGYILQHTNNVFILQGDDVRPMRRDHDDRKDAGRTGSGKQLIVYVDESIVAAELNARRELVKLQFFEQFGEEIDEFKILISHGQYKRHHPFPAPSASSADDDAPAVPLDSRERAAVAEQVSAVGDGRLRRALERAMVADLEWKKGLSQARKSR